MKRLLHVLIVGVAAWRAVEALRIGGTSNIALALSGVFVVGLLAGGRVAIWALAGRRPTYTEIAPGDHP